MPHKPIKYIKLYFIWRKNIQKFVYVQFLLYIRHAPSLNKFRVGIHSESTFASCGTYAKMGVFRQAQRLSYSMCLQVILCKHKCPISP